MRIYYQVMVSDLRHLDDKWKGTHLVNKPVLTANTIFSQSECVTIIGGIISKQRTSRLMSVLERAKPLLEVCRMTHRLAAIATSPAAANAFMRIERVL